VINFDSSRIALLLIALAPAFCFAETEKAGQAPAVLTYSAESSSHPSAIVLKAPSGKAYRLSLVPDHDIRNHVVVLELVLQKRAGRNDANLLDWTGKLHGYQPYSFAASDFARGAQDSIYGEERVIELRKLGMRMRVKVVAVKVEPTTKNPSESLPYQFDELTLHITTQSLAGGASR
jgi:hypothetical protein